MRFSIEAFQKNGIFVFASRRDRCPVFRFHRKGECCALNTLPLGSKQLVGLDRANPELRCTGKLSSCRVQLKNDQASHLLNSSTLTSTRRAFTLLELLIVLVLLVALLAIVWPQINRRIQRSELKNVAVGLKEGISDARSAAIETGETWKLQFSEYSNVYALGPVSGFREDSAQEMTIQTGRRTTGDDSESRTSLVAETELPVSVLLTTSKLGQLNSGNSRRLSDSPRTIPVGNASDDADDPAKTEVLFYPDGRASETEIVILDRRAKAGIELKIRGLTGQVEIGGFLRIDIELEEDEFEADANASRAEDDLNLELED